MARVRVTVYKNSVPATCVSFIGSCVVLCSVVMIVSAVLSMLEGFNADSLMAVFIGVFLAACGLGLQVLGGHISEKKTFNQWVKQIREKGLEPRIAASSEAARQVLKTNPTKMAVNYISKLNPEFGEAYRQARKRRK